jgi:dTDP-4-dehydrorhamnose 3,5-epimerase
VPEGFAHGFYVTSESAEFIYKCTDYYNPKAEVSIIWDDPTLNIKWPVNEGETPLLSDKDINGIIFSDSTCVSIG